MKIFLRNIQITTVSSGSSVNIGKTLNVVRTTVEPVPKEGVDQEAEMEITPSGPIGPIGPLGPVGSIGPVRGVEVN